MTLLNKFTEVKIDNSSRIDPNLYKELFYLQKECDKKHKLIEDRIFYLKQYSKENENPFDDFCKDYLQESVSNYRSFVYETLQKINEFYQTEFYLASQMYSDGFSVAFGDKKVITVEDILEYCFKINEGVSFEESGIQKTKNDLFEIWNNRYKKPLPSIAKNGVITLPKMIYIEDSWHSEYIKISYSDEHYIGLLEKSINLYKNQDNKKNNMLYDWKAESVEEDKRKFSNYYKKKAVKINKSGLEEVTLFGNGNVKIKFEDVEDSKGYFEYFNLGVCKNR